MPGFTEFVSRIQTDYAFYLQFRQNAQEALASYKLSSEEQTSVTAGGRELWSQLGQFLPDAESLGPASRVHFGIDPALKTNIGWIRVRQSRSVDLDFSPEVVLRKPEVQQTIAEIRGTSVRNDRLAAVLTLLEYVE
jgi:hypothetical protein